MITLCDPIYEYFNKNAHKKRMGKSHYKKTIYGPSIEQVNAAILMANYST